MLKTRLIPCLLFKDLGLVKTRKFQEPQYVGDPINAVRIFNQKEVDELIFLDICATKDGRTPEIGYIHRLSDECFMPLTCGGGIKTIKDIRTLINSGVEKVAINTAAVENPKLIAEASAAFGAQSILVSIDAKLRSDKTYEVFTHSGQKATGIEVSAHAKKMESFGAGEIMINSIDRDGEMTGYDLKLIKLVADVVSIPVIALGGAGQLTDFIAAVERGHASAASAGAYFVFYGQRRAVLISYPSKSELKKFQEAKPQ